MNGSFEAPCSFQGFSHEMDELKEENLGEFGLIRTARNTFWKEPLNSRRYIIAQN
jgi:hypothetical protein